MTDTQGCFYAENFRAHGARSRRPSAERVDGLALAARSGDERAMAELTERVLAPIAYSMSQRHNIAPTALRRGLTREDLRQEAMEGMLRALGTWREDGTARFRSWAYSHASFAISNAANDATAVTMGRGNGQLAGQYLLKGERPPKLRDETWAAMVAAFADPRSLEAPAAPGEQAHGGEHLPLGSVIEDGGAGGDFEAVLREDDKRRMRVALARAGLTRLEVVALARRYGLDGEPPQTYRQIGALVGRSQERVRQTELRALEKLRVEMKKSDEWRAALEAAS